MLMSSADLQGLVGQAMYELSWMTMIDYNRIMLRHARGHEGRLVTVADDVSPGSRTTASSFDGPLGKATASGRTTNASDVAAVQDHFQAVPSTRSEFVVPISEGGSIVRLETSDAADELPWVREVIVTLLGPRRRFGLGLWRGSVDERWQVTVNASVEPDL